MKPIRWIALICLMLSLWPLLPKSSNAVLASEPGQKVCFAWAFGALVGSEADRELVSITQDTKLKSGDQFKMLVQLKKKCFVYLIHSSSQGEIQLLFPRSIKQFSDNYQIAEKYYIPRGDLWFALDEKTGVEKFYLLASAKRLKKLETLLGDYASAGENGKPHAAEQIISEIKRLKRKHKSLQAAAERPVSIGGTVRGDGPLHDVAAVAVEISAAEFFSRTFTIEHQ